MANTRKALSSFTDSIKTIPKRIALSRKIAPIVKDQVQAILDQYGMPHNFPKKISPRKISGAANTAIRRHLSHLGKSKSMTPSEYDILLSYLDSMKAGESSQQNIVGLTGLAKSVKIMISFLANDTLNGLGLRATYDKNRANTILTKIDLRRESESES